MTTIEELFGNFSDASTEQLQSMANESTIADLTTGMSSVLTPDELNDLINSTILKFNNKLIKFNRGEDFVFNGRKLSIQRCLNNLIENSTKFANKIEITFQKLKSNIFIFIEDDGPGIPIQERENVFKPFYKIDKSRSQKSSSVGLGLSISTDIIRSHGGKIELSDSKFGGLKVLISLPF